MKDILAAVETMLERQIKARGIRDPRVLVAMKEVPRHRFVDAALVNEAYDDNPLPIGEGQTISQPYMVAVMTQLLRLQGHERVLEIGTGSGYQAAILARLCARVYTVERIPSLSDRARRIISQCGYDNITFLLGDGTEGWRQDAPYDGIMVTAGAPKIPETLVAQLIEGGRLVVPVGDRVSQTLKRVTMTTKGPITEDFTGCRFVDLIGKHGWSE
ncbi:MAG: protein-L-isoaspartate(D-aspartate) O-methyltransferase [Pseudomonadota bacterium]